MKARKPENLTFYYIYLAVSCAAVGVGITFLVLFICQLYNIDIVEHLWIIAIPVVLSLIINVTIIELYRRLRR